MDFPRTYQLFRRPLHRFRHLPRRKRARFWELTPGWNLPLSRATLFLPLIPPRAISLLALCIGTNKFIPWKFHPFLIRLPVETLCLTDVPKVVIRCWMPCKLDSQTLSIVICYTITKWERFSMAHNGNYTHQTLRERLPLLLKFAVLRSESASWFSSIIHILIS